MKLRTALICLPLMIGVGAQAESILDNNFDAIAPGSYDGISGAPFAEGESLAGHASGNSSVECASGAGVGKSGGLLLSSNGQATVRSSTTAGFEQETRFSMFFQFQTPKAGNAAIGFGWALPGGTDGTGFFNQNVESRFMVGLSVRGGEDAAQFAALGTLSQPIPLDAGEMILTGGNWYQLSGSLAFDGSGTWTLRDLAVTDWGADGLTDRGVVGSLESTQVVPSTIRRSTFGEALEQQADPQAHAVFTANEPRGVAALDNLSVTTDGR